MSDEGTELIDRSIRGDVVLVERAVRSRLGSVAGPVLVALDGRSAAGKSSLADLLASRLDAVIVHGDDFYRDTTEAARLELSPRQGVDRYFDWQRMREEALLPLCQGRPATFRPFDWERGFGLTGRKIVEPKPVVIVEGVYSSRPEFDDLLHLKVLVDTPADVRERRRRARHDPSEWEQRWDAAESIFFESVRPRGAFDLVVTGSGGGASSKPRTS